ncbi:MAG: M67 family metallopeptidase [Thermoplasmata archaeon]|nr:M67 family metallopeptidase [Thermoplasmata archaeon]
MRVVLPERIVEQIRRHGEATYPEECCGFLVARESVSGASEARRILRVMPMENRVEGERDRRFVIPPEELRKVERSLEGTGESVAGFYHSHPDHPAAPSLFDEENAWPWYTYLVLSVDHGRAGELGAFELDADDRRFAPVPWAAGPEESPAR